jgi:cold shock CspA family protein
MSSMPRRCLGELKGVVKFYNTEKGFGFIRGEDGQDAFVHITNCGDGMMPVEGDVLLYDLGPSTKKPGQSAALNVTGGSAKQTPRRPNDFEALTTKINQQAASSASLKAEVRQLQSDLATMAKEQAANEMWIKDMRDEYNTVKADFELGLSSVRQALDVLRSYHDAAASVQQPASPQTHEKSGGADDSITGIFECCERDFATNSAKEYSEMSDSQDTSMTGEAKEDSEAGEEVDEEKANSETEARNSETNEKNALCAKRRTKKRDPNAPKRPLSALTIFARENREKIKKSLPDGQKISDVSKLCVVLWRGLTDAEKKPFQAKSDKLAEKYKKAMDVFVRHEG